MPDTKKLATIEESCAYISTAMKVRAGNPCANMIAASTVIAICGAARADTIGSMDHRTESAPNTTIAQGTKFQVIAMIGAAREERAIGENGSQEDNRGYRRYGLNERERHRAAQP